MLPRPGAETAVSNGMPSCWKMRANQRIVSTSLPGGLVVLMWRYSRARRTASSCSCDCAPEKGAPAARNRIASGVILMIEEDALAGAGNKGAGSEMNLVLSRVVEARSKANRPYSAQSAPPVEDQSVLCADAS